MPSPGQPGQKDLNLILADSLKGGVKGQVPGQGTPDGALSDPGDESESTANFTWTSWLSKINKIRG